MNSRLTGHSIQPEIYARIVGKDDFDTFHWHGAAFDREIVSLSFVIFDDSKQS